VVVPIVAPILLADPSANVTAVWLGVMIGLNIQTSFLTPPFGFALFYLRGVAPAVVKTLNMYKGVIAFIVLQLIALGIVGYYPPLVNYLPSRVSLLSETAPPPRNPKLQYCVEEYTYNLLAENGAAFDQTLANARALDLSVLPESLAKSLSASFDKAEEARTLLADVKAAELAELANRDAYRALHSQVRDIELKIRDIDPIIDQLETTRDRLSGDQIESRRDALNLRIENLKRDAQLMMVTREPFR